MAASNATKIAKLKATVNGGEFPAEGIVINLTVGSPAAASVTAVPKSESKITRLFTTSVVSTLQKRQQQRLAGRSTPDVIIAAEDGLGGSITFLGFMAAPALELSPRQVADKFSVLGVDSLLDGLDLGIYRADPPSSREETSSGSLKPLIPSTDGNVTALLASITDVLVSNYAIGLSMMETPSEKLLTQQQHSQNQRAPLRLWKNILDASSVVYETWAKLAAKHKTLPAQMAAQAQAMLQQPTSGFWNVVNSLLAGFQMLYIPNANGSGKLIRMDKRVAEDPTQEIELSITSLSILDGSRRIMQIGGVVMIAPTIPSSREETSGPPSIAGQSPRPLRDGYVHRVPPPVWLVDAQGVPIVDSEVDDAVESDASTFDYNIAAAKVRMKEGRVFAREVGEASNELLDEICSVYFKDFQYADSTGSFSVPLNFALRVGERTKFSVPNGGSFVGFVNGISHRIDLRSGKELDSVTQLDVTHIQY